MLERRFIRYIATVCTFFAEKFVSLSMKLEYVGVHRSKCCLEVGVVLERFLEAIKARQRISYLPICKYKFFESCDRAACYLDKHQ